MRKKYNTPRRDRYIRARLTSEEKADFDVRHCRFRADYDLFRAVVLP